MTEQSFATRSLHDLYRLTLRIYHRAESHGIEHMPDGGALIVGNHSGGAIPMDVPAISLAFWNHFGHDRKVLTLTHDIMFKGPWGSFFTKFGLIPATRAGAREALADGGYVIVFPGGDLDVNRTTWERNTIVFSGRTGYVTTAIEAGKPIVPVVSIGGHETYLVLARSARLAKLSGPVAKMMRIKEFPVIVGFPWGVNLGFPPPLPLPSKIVTRFLEPIDPADFGPDPDPVEIDEVVRARMQEALDELARQRRLPVIG